MPHAAELDELDDEDEELELLDGGHSVTGHEYHVHPEPLLELDDELDELELDEPQTAAP